MRITRYRFFAGLTIIFLGVYFSLPFAKRANKFKYAYGVAYTPISQSGHAQADNLQTTVSHFLQRPHNLIAASKTGNVALEGSSGWLYYHTSLHFALHDEAKYLAAVAPITDFSDQLANRGIQLTVLLIPSKWEIHPEGIGGSTPSAELGATHAGRKALADSLEASGVSVIDASYDLLLERARSPDLALFTKGGTHWTPKGAETVARSLAPRLRAETKDMLSRHPTSQEGTVTFKNFLAGLLHRVEIESYPARIVEQVPNNPAAARVMLLGDSFSLPDLDTTRNATPRFCGLPAQLRIELREPISWIVIEGASANGVRLELAHRLSKAPDLLKKTKEIVWAIGPRSFADNFEKTPLPREIPTPKPIDSSAPGERRIQGQEVVLLETPDLEALPSSPYPEALITCRFLSGNQEFLGSLAGMKAHQPLPIIISLLPGQRFLIDAQPWDSVNEHTRSIRRIDETQDFRTPHYWISSIDSL